MYNRAFLVIQLVSIFVHADAVLEHFAPVEVALASMGGASAADFRQVAEFFVRCGSVRRASFFATVAAEMDRCESAIVTQAELPDLDQLCDLCVDGIRHEHV